MQEKTKVTKSSRYFKIGAGLVAIIIGFIAAKVGLLMPILGSTTGNALGFSGLLAMLIYGLQYIKDKKVKEKSKMVIAVMMIVSGMQLILLNIANAADPKFKDIKGVATHVGDQINTSVLPMIANIGGVAVLIYGIATLNRSAFILGFIILAFMYFYFGWIGANYSLK